MRTLGIDLSANDKKTATCFIEWSDGRARVDPPEMNHGNAALVELIQRADKTGIDAPFGWPEDFIAAIGRYADGESFPTGTDRSRLRFRETDTFVKNRGRLPLSVSSDRIAVTAMRCAGLLTELAQRGDVADRTGDTGRVVEVYPASALAAWGFDVKGYKDKQATDVRERLLSVIEEACAPWLQITDDARAKCAASDDPLDAFVSSLIARAAAVGKTTSVPDELRDAARREGWIHLPHGDALAGLAG